MLTDHGTPQDQAEAVDVAVHPQQGEVGSSGLEHGDALADTAGATGGGADGDSHDDVPPATNKAPDVVERFLEAFHREALAVTAGVLGRSELRCLQRAAEAVGRDGYFADLSPSPIADDDLPSPVPPAAWYPDPTGRHQLRYWNGDRWTAHVADDGTADVDHG